MASPRWVFPATLSIFAALCFAAASASGANSWNDAAGELAHKIASHTGTPAGMALSVRNLSSLGDSDVAEVRRALRAQLRGLGLRSVARQRATVEVRVTLSENSQGYLWVAEIQRGETREVKMISVPRMKGGAPVASAETLVIRKVPLFAAEEPILDLALVNNATEVGPSMLVLQPERIALFKKQSTSWTLDQSAPITHLRPLPRDPRGRLITRPEGSFEAYLPGLKCNGRIQSSLSADCHEGDDLWPLESDAGNAARAHLAPDRNSFDGRFTLESGENKTVPPFFSAARLAEEHETIWLLAGVDGHARLFGKGPKPLADIEDWGNDLVGLQSGCGTGRQVLVTRAADFTASDAVEGYEVVNRKAVSVGTPVEFSGPIVSLWPGSNSASATAVVRNLEKQRYEAFTLSIACGQ